MDKLKKEMATAMTIRVWLGIFFTLIVVWFAFIPAASMSQSAIEEEIRSQVRERVYWAVKEQLDAADIEYIVDRAVESALEDVKQ